jgi:enamine deaminase RidA (YjgF/YER057c/UK114 family)
MSALPPGVAHPLARYAAYRRVGDWLYLSGVIAVDPVAGRIVNGYADIPEAAAQSLGRSGEFSVDVKEGPILAQSWYVLERIRHTVESAGGQMSDVFKLVQYFKNLDHFPYYNRVRKMFFPDQAPASTVVEVSAMLPSAAILIEVEATAYLGRVAPADPSKAPSP